MSHLVRCVLCRVSPKFINASFEKNYQNYLVRVATNIIIVLLFSASLIVFSG